MTESEALERTKEIMHRLCVKREISKGEAYQQAEKIWKEVTPSAFKEEGNYERQKANNGR